MKSKKEHLPVRWQYDAGSDTLVWQLMFTETGDLVGQKRCIAARKALFFSIDTATGKVLCDDYLLTEHCSAKLAGEGWFTGFETTFGAFACCYACQSQSPEHQGIWVIDFRGKKVVWSRPDIGFVAHFDNKMVVATTSVFGGFPERQFLLVDPLDGKNIPLPDLDSVTINEIRENAVQEHERQHVILPDVVTQEMVAEHRVLQRTGISETGCRECIVQDPVTIVAHHEPVELPGSWRSRIEVWHDDTLVYSDCMEKSVESRPCLNNFLVRSGALYYIRDKRELICVALS